MIVSVCAAGCTYASLATAVKSVPPGSTIVVRGPNRGGAVVDRRITISGEDGATLSQGTAGIVVRAAGTVIEALRFAGYTSPDLSDKESAVVILAPGVTVRECVFERNTFAIAARGARNLTLDGNVIEGLANVPSAPSGDAIRLWSSPNAKILSNTITNGRDVLISYSAGVLFSGNSVASSRYGLHDMFSDAMRVERNVFNGNEIGANFMYARGVRVEGNTFERNHGAMGYGAAFEDVDASSVGGNRFLENHVAFNAVDSPADPAAPDRIGANLFAHNGSALQLQSNPHALAIAGNAFVDNLEDVGVSGGGTAADVTWSAGGRGNYWSAYAGYDRNGDGIGDVAYAPIAPFDSLTDTHPELALFRYSPAGAAFEFAARALPASASQPKLIDRAPLMHIPAQLAGSSRPSPSPLAALLAMLSIVPLEALRRSRRIRGKRARAIAAPAAAANPTVVDAIGVRKTYSQNAGIEDVTLRVKRGESVALWGPNGAGKTTFFRCILGEKTDGGTLLVFGTVPTPRDRTARALIGYAPQYLPDVDCTVYELAQLVAALRGCDFSEADRVLAAVGIGTQGRLQQTSRLSGGMRQRLSVALALVGDPPLLLLDEPTSGLDRSSREAIVVLLNAQRRRGKTLLITSHLLEDVCALADRVVTIESGRTAGESSTSEFAAAYLRNIS